MKTTPGDRNPRRSCTKSLLGVLAATVLLAGATVAPTSASATVNLLESRGGCRALNGWWVDWAGACVLGGGGSDNGGGGGSGSSGGDDDGIFGNGNSRDGIDSIELPSSDLGLDDKQLEEILTNPDLSPAMRWELEKIWWKRQGKDFYPEDPNVFDPHRLSPWGPPRTVTARAESPAGPRGKSPARAVARRTAAQQGSSSRRHARKDRVRKPR